MKNFSDTIGNWIRDLPACSSVPQPSAPPQTFTICTEEHADLSLKCSFLLSDFNQNRKFRQILPNFPISNVKEIRSNATIFTRRPTGVNLNYFSKLHPDILSGLSPSGVFNQYSVCISYLSHSPPTSSSLISLSRYYVMNSTNFVGSNYIILSILPVRLRSKHSPKHFFKVVHSLHLGSIFFYYTDTTTT